MVSTPIRFGPRIFLSIAFSFFSSFVGSAFSAIPADPAGTNRVKSALQGSPDGDGVWSAIAPPPRVFEGAIYEPLKDRMVVLCGRDPLARGDAWSFSFVDARWSRLTQEGTIPPRGRPAVAYDPVRRRALVYGGENAGSALGDLWELTLDGQAKWRQIVPAGSGPGPRRQAVAIYDPVGDRLLLFGGSDGPTTFNDVWELTLGRQAAWRLLAVSEPLPPAAVAPTGVYDPIRRRLIVHVGQFLRETWALELSAGGSWSKLAQFPVQRRNYSLIYDPNGDRLLLHGGTDNSGGSAWETYQLPLTGSPAWSLLPTQNNRFMEGHSAIFDPIRRRMVTYGNSGLLTDVRSLTLDDSPTWSVISRPAPSLRPGCVLVYDSRRDRVLLWGGPPWSGNEVFELPLRGAEDEEWRVLPTANDAPPAIGGGIGFYDALRDRVLIFAGYSSNAFKNSVWELALDGTPTWQELTIGGPLPSPRQSPAGAYDAQNDRWVVFGGVVDGVILGDTWALELSPQVRWVELETGSSKPAPRWASSAVYDPEGQRLVLFAGLSGLFYSTALNEAWTLDLQGPPTWALLNPGGDVPLSQISPAAIYDPVRRRMLVTGKPLPSEDFAATWSLSLDGEPTWRLLQPSTPGPSSREQTVAVYDPVGDRQILFGGYNLFTFNDTWALSLRHAETSAAGAIATESGQVASRNVLSLQTSGRARSGDGLEVHFNAPGLERVSLELFDLSGRRMDRLHVLPASGKSNARLASGQRLVPGIYFVRLVQGAASATRRVAVLSSR